ncbi:alpha beta-hydrolase [Coniophora puteana RWD-64-598 SS2]|uniref:Alpha beta-hydrolase n=1 Tax=Coniophora puteana (strain RWD-64-598) TaxID=741705 RepID=A0A5M3M869_CONPW|nr:alpha beta-hydrolase [Coniophora puteana RWD-64-598 SS2]EIW75126.1 alpha beta-hydrolase [Coniophora puteana RWD-64-598 SS2]
MQQQPARGAYVTYDQLSTRFVRAPTWLIRSLVTFWRPRPQWDWNRNLKVLMLRHSLVVGDKLGPSPKKPLQHTFLDLQEQRKIGPKVKGVWVDPVPDQIHGYIAQWAEVAKVRPERIPGYWMDKIGLNPAVGEALQPGEKILYRMHAGCYVALSAHQDSPVAALCRGFLENYKSFRRAFSIEYRLSTGPPHSATNPFPAALMDALAGYNYLINTVGVQPSDIVFVGDSAGGNLAVALTRYLVEQQTVEGNNVPPPPSALILVSPWADLGDSHEGPNTSMKRLKKYDPLGALPGQIAYAKTAFAGPFGKEFLQTNEWVSPASKHAQTSFAGFPRTFINAGGVEIFVDQIRTLKDRMIADMGEGDGPGQVKYLEAPEGIHTYLNFGWFEPERTDTYRKIAAWLG